MATQPKTDKTTTETPVEAPKAPRPKKAESLFVAYQADVPSDPSGFVNLVVFGRKIDAADHALEQDPAWKVIEIHKGEPLLAAVRAKNGLN
jgi:hypothetical protein